VTPTVLRARVGAAGAWRCLRGPPKGYSAAPGGLAVRCAAAQSDCEAVVPRPWSSALLTASVTPISRSSRIVSATQPSPISASTCRAAAADVSASSTVGLVFSSGSGRWEALRTPPEPLRRVRRNGFHGTSYRFVSEWAAALDFFLAVLR